MKTTIITTLIAILSFSVGLSVRKERKLGAGTFDTKGQDVRFQVLVKEPNYNDAVYYSPTEWEKKTEAEINAEKKARYDNWKKIIDEESKKITPPNEEVIID